MSKVFEAYHKRRGLAARACRFLIDGERIQGEDTPATVNTLL